MKILVVALNFSPEIVGCAKFTSEFVDWFSKKAKKVIVITTNHFYPEWKVKSNRYKKSNTENILIIRCPIYVPKKLNGLNRILHYLSFFITTTPIILYYGLKDIDLAFTMCPTILSAPNIVSKVGSRTGLGGTGGFNEVLSKVADAHPRSDLAKSIKRRSAKEVKTDEVIDKHAKIQARQKKQGIKLNK